MTDAELYDRMTATLLASWEANARGCEGAAVRQLPGAVAAVFPHGPERDVYDNAILARGLDRDGAGRAIGAIEACYEAAAVGGFAVWAREGEETMLAALRARGYELVETTLAMAMPLGDAALPRPAIPGVEIGGAGWDDYLRYLRRLGLPPELLTGVEPSAYRVLAAREGGELLATGLAFDHDGDCGVFNLSTLEGARRRGIGTALTARLLADARARGCATASLQSTPIAEGVYTGLGFRPLGRFLEHSRRPAPPFLDHVSLAADRSSIEELGFTVTPTPGDAEHGRVHLAGSYLEVTPSDGGPRGSRGWFLRPADLETAAELLRRAGLPAPAPRSYRGADGIWLDLELAAAGPALPVLTRRLELPAGPWPPAAGPPHANGATRLAAVQVETAEPARLAAVLRALGASGEGEAELELGGGSRVLIEAPASPAEAVTALVLDRAEAPPLTVRLDAAAGA
jgi:ribosomal protein S18 acetylase RimI-like enzyme